MVLNPTATFVGKGTRGVATFYLRDKTAQAPVGTSGHHYFYTGISYGLSPRTDVFLYHSRVLGRFEDEHLQMSGVQIKQRLSRTAAVGIFLQQGNQRGESVFFALRFPLASQRGAGEERRDILHLHAGILFSRWRGEWRGEDWTPYLGLSWQLSEKWLLTAEIREHPKSFLKPPWMVAVHRSVGQLWLVVGWHQSGLSDRPYPFIGIGTAAAIVR